MKHFKRLLCLVLAVVMFALALASCGGEEPQDTTPPVTTNGDTTTAPTTTAPTTTAPTGNETTAPPVTNPPETVAPCATHTFAEGKLCTEERTCTVCQETVPAGDHTYYGYCTAVRPCVNCDYECPAVAEHVMGAVYACETQKCENCDFALYGKRCDRETLYSPCKVCGLTPPTAIPFITIDGAPIKNFTVVIPTYPKNLTHDYEHYVSALMRNKISTWHNVKLSVVSDTVEKSGPEIRIGHTNRTVTECGENEYIIRVVNGDLEILCGGMYAFEGLLNLIDTLFVSSANDGITFVEGTDLTASFTDKPEDARMGDLRILYHNTLFFDGNGKSRFAMYKSLYTHYAPDVICLQEAAPQHFMDNTSLNLRTYLHSIGYKDFNLVTEGSPHPVFYKTSAVKLVANGFEKGPNWYGTAWALFQHKESGTYFGLGNSHFVAGSMVSAGQSLNELQCQDAQALLRAKEKILEAAVKEGVENVDTIPLIFGGDYNCRLGSDPLQILEDGGLVNTRIAIEDQTMVDDYVTYGRGPSYNQEYDYHGLNSYPHGAGNGLNGSIDHVYLGNEGTSFTANQYRVIRNLIAGGCSDHQPHYVDISFK